MKLVTWNTQWCRGLDGAVSTRRIVEAARAMADFDVLCLQEIASGFEAMPGAPGDQPAELRALLPGFRLFFGAAVDEFDREGREKRFGNLVASRLPVSRVAHHPLPWPSDPGASSMPRMCTVLTLDSPELGPVRLMTTHLEYYSSKQRTAQAKALAALHAEACEQAAAPPKVDYEGPFGPKLHTAEVILCGDFNMPASDPAHAVLREHLRDAWPLVHGSEAHAPTFRLFDRKHGPDPVTYDFVFVSEGLAPRVRRIEVDVATKASDHQPVMVEFA